MGNLRTREAAEVRTFPMELRAVDARTMEGLVCPYGGEWPIGGFTETLLPGVFKKSLAESPAPIPLMRYHEYEDPAVAVATEWRDTDEGLVGVFTFDTRPDAEEAARLAAGGFLSGLSVGFTPVRSSWDDSGEVPHVDRHEAVLREVSLTSVPAFPSARVLAVRSMGAPERPGTAIKPTPRMDALRQYLDSLGV